MRVLLFGSTFIALTVVENRKLHSRPILMHVHIPTGFLCVSWFISTWLPLEVPVRREFSRKFYDYLSRFEDFLSVSLTQSFPRYRYIYTLSGPQADSYYHAYVAAARGPLLRHMPNPMV